MLSSVLVLGLVGHVTKLPRDPQCWMPPSYLHMWLGGWLPLVGAGSGGGGSCGT